MSNKTSYLTIRLTPQEFAALKKEAERQTRSLSEQARHFMKAGGLKK